MRNKATIIHYAQLVSGEVLCPPIFLNAGYLSCSW